MTHSVLRKLAYGIAAVLTLPLLLFVLPIMVAFGHSSASKRMATLPGISPRGGLKAGVLLAAYHLLAILVVAAVITGALFVIDDGGSNDLGDTITSDTNESDAYGDDSESDENDGYPLASVIHVETYGYHTEEPLWGGEIVLEDAAGEVIETHTISDEPHEVYLDIHAEEEEGPRFPYDEFTHVSITDYGLEHPEEDEVGNTPEEWADAYEDAFHTLREEHGYDFGSDDLEEHMRMHREWREEHVDDEEEEPDPYEDYDRHEVVFDDLDPDETYTVTVTDANGGAWPNTTTQVTPGSDTNVTIEPGYQVQTADSYRYRTMVNHTGGLVDYERYSITEGGVNEQGHSFRQTGVDSVLVEWDRQSYADGKTRYVRESSDWEWEKDYSRDGLTTDGLSESNPTMVSQGERHYRHAEFKGEMTLNGSLINDHFGYARNHDRVSYSDHADEKFDNLTVHIYQGATLGLSHEDKALFSLDHPDANATDRYYLVDAETGYVVASTADPEEPTGVTEIFFHDEYESAISKDGMSRTP